MLQLIKQSNISIKFETSEYGIIVDYLWLTFQRLFRYL